MKRKVMNSLPLVSKCSKCDTVLKEIFHVQFGFAEIYTYNASYPRSFDCCCKYTNHLGLQPSLGSVFKVRWYKGMKVIKLVHIGCVLSYFRFVL